jgi:hypothetical protein
MAKTYDEYEVDEMAKAKKRGDDYATQRKAQADEAVKTSDGVYDAAMSKAENDAEASVKETEVSYRDVYDANAVTELVARRNTEEAMANMGLTDSGLNRTQQTAISLQRGRADTKATQQKQAAVDAIMRELDNYRTQNTAEKAAASRNIYAQADTDIVNYRNNEEALARQNAANLYAADQERAAAQYAADKEYAAKMAASGYVYNEAAGGYVKADTQAEKTISMNSTGTPSYTAIDTQAGIYSRSDKAKASEYINRQYEAGYIDYQQRNELLGKYGRGGLVWAENELYTLDEYNGIRRPPYGSYSNYVKHMITEWANEGLITPDEARAIAVDKGVYSG